MARLAHGGDLDAARRLFPGAPQPFLDLSTGVNPHSYPFAQLPSDAFTRLPQPEAAARLWTNLEQFVAVQPRFISVTCGAGGSGVDGTLPLVSAIQERFGIPVGGIFTGLDACYHRRCDTVRNVDLDVLEQSAEAAEAALRDLS